MVTRILSYDEEFWQRVQDWKAFDFDAIRREAMRMHDEHNLNGVRVGPVMRQDSLDYWIAVATWNRAKNASHGLEYGEPKMKGGGNANEQDR